MGDPQSWILIVILLLSCLFFSISETALSCCNRYKMQVKADEGSILAKIVIHLLDKYNQSLAVTLIGNNAVSLAASSVSTIIFVTFLIGTPIENLASLLSTIFITILIFIFGDGLAKTIGKAIPDTISKIICIPLLIIFYLLYPISILFELLIKLFERLTKKAKIDTISEDDLGDIIEKIEDDGIIEEEQSEIIQSALEFDDTKVIEVLTKVSDMSLIELKDLNHPYIQEYLTTHNFSRIPIYQRDTNNIVGILIVKNYLKQYAKDPTFNIKKILQKPYFVYSNTMIDDIFLGLKRHHTHLAIVRDRSDKVIGMVTMEDILEEIVSDIEEKPLVKRGKKI